MDYRPGCQPTTLIVSEDDSALDEFFFENLVLGAEARDDFLLLAIDPAGRPCKTSLAAVLNAIF
jgi:hypothetical protein